MDYLVNPVYKDYPDSSTGQKSIILLCHYRFSSIILRALSLNRIGINHMINGPKLSIRKLYLFPWLYLRIITCN